jgi:nitrate reductase (NAD(P)H)
MPPIPHRTHHKAHPGSNQDEIDNEPDWKAGGNHRIGFRNKHNRFPGLTHVGDDEEQEFEHEALGKITNLQSKIKKGELVNFRDVIKNQEVNHMICTGLKQVTEISLRTTTSVDQMYTLSAGDMCLKPRKSG